jgi:hypothetical protein
MVFTGFMQPEDFQPSFVIFQLSHAFYTLYPPRITYSLRTVSQSDSQSLSQSDSQSDRQSGSQTASHSVSQSDSQADSQSVRQSDSQSVSQLDSQSVSHRNVFCYHKLNTNGGVQSYNQHITSAVRFDLTQTIIRVALHQSADTKHETGYNERTTNFILRIQPVTKDSLPNTVCPVTTPLTRSVPN